MSKVKIQGNASGTGVLTVEAPNTNTDRTITLPDAAGEVLVNGTTSNVGIGTSSPSYPLHIKNAGSTACRLSLENSGSTGSGYTQIWSQNNDLAFTAGNSERMRIDSSGNVGIGVTPETSNKTGDLHGVWGSIGGWSNTMFFNNNAYYNSGWKYKNTALASSYESKDGKHYFYVAPSGTADSAISWTTAMRIDNVGNVAFKGGTYGTYIYSGAGSNAGRIDHDHDGDYSAEIFYRNGATKGWINVSSAGTSYATASDYRLKENVVPMTGSIDRLKELNPSRFNFIADADKTVDGFLAHEAGEVVPEAISGEKDAMRTEEYEVTPALGNAVTYLDTGEIGQVHNEGIEEGKQADGHAWVKTTEAVMGEREVEDYQGIDQSKLVPLLTSALQEAVAKIEALETRVTQLENS